MRRSEVLFLGQITFALILFCCLSAAFAEESKEELKKRIEILNEKVTELEEKLEEQPSSKRGFARGWDPLEEIERMQEKIDQMFQEAFSNRGRDNKGIFNSKVFYDENFDLEETEVGYVIRLDIAGIDKEKIDIEINKYSLTVSGESSVQEEQTNPDGFFSSRSYGKFLKTIPLPVDADMRSIETSKEGNDIVIKIPKKG